MKREIGAIGASCSDCGKTAKSDIRPDGAVVISPCTCRSSERAKAPAEPAAAKEKEKPAKDAE